VSKRRICQASLIFLFIALPPQALLACDFSQERRLQLFARFVLYKCLRSGVTLSCLSEKGFRCQPVADWGWESYRCIPPINHGFNEVLITYSHSGWAVSKKPSDSELY